MLRENSVWTTLSRRTSLKVPQGRLKWEGRSPVFPQLLLAEESSQDFIRGNDQPSLRDCIL